jgi:translation initiation factor IF-2
LPPSSEIFELRLASTTLRRRLWQALSTNNIDMSSTEPSGAPAEASETNPAPAAASFGSTRGSGLARGKAKRPSAPVAATAASSDYTPTAIEVVTAPREYQNPFAPVETPATVIESVAPVAPAPVAHAPVAPAPVAAVETSAVPEPVVSDEPAELNILEPEQQKTAPAQTWESEGFRPARESRNDRPRREESRRDEPRREAPAQEERAEQAPFDPSSIPAKFLYVRPGYNYVPTPSNYGGAPREPRPDRAAGGEPSRSQARPAPAAETAAPSGGFFSWLKSLFGSSATPAPAGAAAGEPHAGDRGHGHHRSERGGRPGGGDGQRRRSRGGRNRNRGEYRGGGQGERGSSQGGGV